MIPTLILHMWLLGLLSLGLAGGAIYFGHEWQERSWGWDPVLERSVFAPEFGVNAATALLAGAVALALLGVVGRVLVGPLLGRGASGSAEGEISPLREPRPDARQRVKRPDGTELEVRFFGPEHATPIVCSHGWGMSHAEWVYLARELAGRFRLVTWDEPGLGRSRGPRNHDYSLTKFAGDLEAVLELAGRPAFLLGHSIGGMMSLTFCRCFPQALGSRVLGLILTHTTPTNPVRTTAGAAFLTVIEKPVLVPLMWMTIALSPVVRLMTWLSYLNGSMHLMTRFSSFGGTQSREQVEFACRFQLRSAPAVLARGMLGMMAYEARDVLPDINVPTLVIAGDMDNVTKPEASEAIHKAVPGSRLITLRPARHLGLIEHHREYARAVHDFIDSVQTRVRLAETAAG